MVMKDLIYFLLSILDGCIVNYSLIALVRSYGYAGGIYIEVSGGGRSGSSLNSLSMDLL